MHENYKIYEDIYSVAPDKKEMGYGNNFQFTYAFYKWSEYNYKLYDELILHTGINSNEGVYMINDFYIGASTNIKSRITGHIHEAFYERWNKHFNEIYDGDWDLVGFNSLKADRIHQSLFSNGGLIINVLSDNIEDETKLINRYLDFGYNLQNIKETKARLEEVYGRVYK